MKKVMLTLLFVFVSTYLFGQVTLPPPTNFTSTQVTGSNYSAGVKLTWSKVAVNNVRYAVYRKAAAENDTTVRYQLYMTYLRDTSWTDYTVQPNKTYTYYAVSYSTTTNMSAPSNKSQILVTQPVVARGWIYGTVTDDSTGTGLSNVYVKFIVSNGPSHSGSNTVKTDSNGRYAYKLYGGNYYVSFSKSGFVGEYHLNATTLQTATKVTVANGDSISINAGLVKNIPPVFYTVKGKVLDSLNRPVSGYVMAYRLRSNTHHLGGTSARIDNQGNYSISVRGGDSIVVFASPSRRDMYFAEYFNNKKTFETANRLGITGNVTGIDFVLDMKPTLPNGIAGTVKDTTNTGVAAHLIAYLMKNGRFERSYVTMSDSLGGYSFTNLKVGKYILKAIPASAYKATYFKYDGTNTLNWQNADSIMVDSVSVTSGINVVVRPRSDSGYARIAGTLRTVSNSAVAGSIVYALNAQNEISGFAVTNIAGYFEMNELEPGVYSVTSDAVGMVQAPAKTVSVDYESALNQSITLVIPNTPTSVEDDLQVKGYTLSQNYPNPFNPSTAIRFSMPESGLVSLSVYNTLGQQVALLVNEIRTAGVHTVSFDASSLPSGVYVYKLNAGSVSLSKKLMLMK